jgi:two-component system, OmpR family, phosphate regulon sensor histidine kinase PhoR
MWPALTIGVALAAGAILVWVRGRYHRLQWQSAQQRSEIGELRAQLQQGRDRAQVQQETIFNNLLDGILVLDVEQRVRLANRTLKSWFNLDDDICGRTLIEVLRQHELQEVVRQAATSKQEAGVELEFALPGGKPVILQTTAKVFADSTGAVQGTIVVFHDLTRLRRLETVRQEFVANVSHELRTPLSMIKGSVETLLDGAKDDPRASVRFLEMIQKHANRLAFLIEDLLTLSRLESGRSPFSLERVELGKMAQRVIEDMQVNAAQRKVTIENQVPAGLQVPADSERIYQVLFNLLDNAVKYGRAEGRVVVGARAAEDGGVEAFVRDDGPGIPGDSVDRIFERFYRVDRARSRDQGGTGLGLAIVKHIVQAHNGKVWVVSKPGQGATFYFTLPGGLSEAVNR